MKYLDANIFICAALDQGKRGEISRRILAKLIKGDPAVTSSLTIDEVVWVMLKETKDRERAIRQGLRILEFPNLKIVSVNSADVYSALKFMKKYPTLKPRDAIHLSVSLNAGIFRIVSDDSDFDDVKEIERERLS